MKQDTNILTPAKKRNTAFLIGLMGASMFAQAEIFSVEGPLQSITDNGGGNGTMVCNGVTLQISPATVINSPTASLTLAQLVSTDPFANSGFNPVSGAARAGFIGSTCIVDGNNDAGPNVADSIFVEVAENVLVGPVSNMSPLAVLGAPIELTTDARMPSTKLAAGLFNAAGVHPGSVEVIRNQFGFGVDPMSIPVGDLSGAEGYLGTDGKLYAHTFESTGGTVVDLTSRASIQRANCRNEPAGGDDSVEIRGGCILPAGVNQRRIQIQGIRANGTVTQELSEAGNRPICTADPEAPGFGLYRLSRDGLTLTNNRCPAQIRARIVNGTLFDYSSVDTR
jgi:hypothetical protein